RPLRSSRRITLQYCKDRWSIRRIPMAEPRVIAERYEVLGVLGSGSYGVVYRVRDRTLGRMVALKELHEALADDINLRRFMAEARVLATHPHPNIVTMFDVGRDGDYPFYTMELITGSRLDTVVPPGQVLDPDRLLAILRDL